MLGDRLSRDLAQAIDHVPHTWRQASFLGDFHQHPRSQGAELGGLVHHRAARAQRRRDLPCGQHERRVPWRNHRHRAQRHAVGDVQLVVAIQALTVARARRLVRVKAEVVCPAQRRLFHKAQCLAGVNALKESDLFGAFLNLVSDAVQDGLALFPAGF